MLLLLSTDMSSEDVESLKETISGVINEKKRAGVWDPCNWQTTIALIAALKLPDKSVADYLESQGAELSTRCLLSLVQKGSAKLLKFVIKELKKAGTWLPEDWFTGLALAEAWFFERKKLYAVFSENDVVFMPEWLITAVKYGDIGLIVKIIHGLKATNRWNPDEPFILQAISEAIKEDANIWYFCLIQEGAQPSFKHLIIAVRHGDCNILKDIIQSLKKRDLWKNNEHNKDITLALEEACVEKDTTSYSTLIEEGAEPNFHCLLTAVKSDYFQLASRIVRDLKLSGQWIKETLRNDWSLTLARDHIAQLPDGTRQTWENLIYGGVRIIQTDNNAITERNTDRKYIGTPQSVEGNFAAEDRKTGYDHFITINYEETNRGITYTSTPPNTPIDRPNVAAVEQTDSLQNNDETNKHDKGIYESQELTEEAVCRSLRRSVSAPVATKEYEVLGEKDKIKTAHRQRHATEHGHRAPSDINEVFIFPQNSDIDIADIGHINEHFTINSGFNDATDNTISDKQGENIENSAVIDVTDRDEAEDSTQKENDINSLFPNRQARLYISAIDQIHENSRGDSPSPCTTPGISRRWVREASLYIGRSSIRIQNTQEILHLRRQFSFSVASIPLKYSYRTHLNYIASFSGTANR